MSDGNNRTPTRWEQTEIVVESELPLPIATLYHEYAHTPQAELRYAYAVRLYQAVLHTLAYIGIADALSLNPPKEKAAKWIALLRKPTINDLHMLIGKTTKFCRSQPDGLFVEEMRTLEREEDWKENADTIREIRNDVAHFDIQVTESEAKEKLGVIKPALERLLRRVKFLRNYRFGYVYAAAAMGRVSHDITWMDFRGRDETAKRIVFRSKTNWPAKVPLLLDKKHQRGLILFPFFRWNLDSSPVEFQFALGIEGDQIRYCHPVRKTPTEDAFYRTCKRENPFKNAGEWLESHLDGGEYIWRFDLELADASKTDLKHGPKRRNEIPTPPERFDMGPQIGEGTFGVVHHAHDKILRIDVAVKFLKPDKAQLHTPRERFEKERRILSQLGAMSRHPNIVQFMEVIADPPGYSMELLNGQTVTEVVNRRNEAGHPISDEDTLNVMAQLLAGLEFIHTRTPQPVLHRDIKPQNLMWCTDGTIKLIDFGIAKAQGTATGTGGLAPAGGTELYQAPEQRDQSSLVDQRTDIYAAGRVLYFLLTGTDPDLDNERLGSHKPRIEPQQDDSPVRRALARVYDKATAVNRNLRYQTAAEMNAAIAQCSNPDTLEHEPAEDGLPNDSSGFVALVAAWQQADSFEQVMVRLGREDTPRERRQIRAKIASLKRLGIELKNHANASEETGAVWVLRHVQAHMAEDVNVETPFEDKTPPVEMANPRPSPRLINQTFHQLRRLRNKIAHSRSIDGDAVRNTILNVFATLADQSASVELADIQSQLSPANARVLWDLWVLRDRIAQGAVPIEELRAILLDILPEGGPPGDSAKSMGSAIPRQRPQSQNWRDHTNLYWAVKAALSDDRFTHFGFPTVPTILNDGTGEAGVRRWLTEQGFSTEAPPHRLPTVADPNGVSFDDFRAIVATSQWQRLTAALEWPDLVTRADLRALTGAFAESGLSLERIEALCAAQAGHSRPLSAGLLGCLLFAARGTDLINFKQRVDRAERRVAQSERFGKTQQTWWDRIIKAVRSDYVVDKTVLNEGNFRVQGGGFDRINQRFNRRLDGLVDNTHGGLLRKLHNEIWHDAAPSADQKPIF